MKKKITVFTPTYNRGYTIHKCYNSLCKQKFKNFEWLIVDDGSNDNTQNIIEKFIAEKKIVIRYFKQENQGKHVAINNGVKLASGELFFIVDSDDYLTENSLQLIDKYWSYPKSDKIVGLGGRRKFINFKNKKFNFHDNYYDQDAISFNLIENNMQDKAEVFKTSVLKKYPFPFIKGEKFLTEAVIWYKIAQDGYDLRWINEDLYVTEYMEDGLSQNAYNHKIQSINSTILGYKLLSSYKLPLKYKARYFINYKRFKILKILRGN